MKGYEKLNINYESFCETYPDNYRFLGMQIGCPDIHGLKGYSQDSWECRNDYCGKCWKEALNKEY